MKGPIAHSPQNRFSQRLARPSTSFWESSLLNSNDAKTPPDIVEVGIIGAGPSGLATARALDEAGISYEILERHNAIGGVWDIDNPGSPMYETAHLVSSKTVSGFEHVPMPDDFPDYPRHTQMMSYIRTYAAHIDLERNVRLNANVVRVARIEGNADATGWSVELRNGQVLRYRTLIVATGMQWYPRANTIPGTFSGELYHSREYRSPLQFAGKRVLVVGGGNSGVDIACDAARIAASADWSIRRGYWIVPKLMFGRPADAKTGLAARILPMRIRQTITATFLRFVVGSLERLGLPTPDHRVYEIPPILNGEILDALSHGDVRVRPDVERFDGNTVYFRNALQGEFDVVVLATGYETRFPFFDSSVVGSTSNLPDLFARMFHRDYDDLMFVGLHGGDGGGLPVMSIQAELAALLLSRKPAALARFRALKATSPDLSGGIRFAGVDRNLLAVSARAYRLFLSDLRDRVRRGDL